MNKETIIQGVISHCLYERSEAYTGTNPIHQEVGRMVESLPFYLTGSPQFLRNTTTHINYLASLVRIYGTLQGKLKYDFQYYSNLIDTMIRDGEGAADSSFTYKVARAFVLVMHTLYSDETKKINLFRGNDKEIILGEEFSLMPIETEREYQLNLGFFYSASEKTYLMYPITAANVKEALGIISLIYFPMLGEFNLNVYTEDEELTTILDDIPQSEYKSFGFEKYTHLPFGTDYESLAGYAFELPIVRSRLFLDDIYETIRDHINNLARLVVTRFEDMKKELEEDLTDDELEIRTRPSNTQERDFSHDDYIAPSKPGSDFFGMDY